VKSIVNVMMDSTTVDYFVSWLVPQCVATVVLTCSTAGDLYDNVRDIVVTNLSAAVRIIVQRSSEWLASLCEI
jgi:hypothetical protein